MVISGDSIIYCDANFLVAYGAGKTKQPEKQKNAKKLFASLLVSKCKIVFSTLVFDEVWNGIRRELGPKTITDYFRFYLNKIIQPVGLALTNYGAVEHSFQDISSDLNNFTNNLLNYPSISIIQLDNPRAGILEALSILNKFKPRDAFHLTYARKNRVTHIVTNDQKFNLSSTCGIDVINY